jgi:hypothetical protein
VGERPRSGCWIEMIVGWNGRLEPTLPAIIALTIFPILTATPDSVVFPLLTPPPSPNTNTNTTTVSPRSASRSLRLCPNAHPAPPEKPIIATRHTDRQDRIAVPVPENNTRLLHHLEISKTEGASRTFSCIQRPSYAPQSSFPSSAVNSSLSSLAC